MVCTTQSLEMLISHLDQTEQGLLNGAALKGNRNPQVSLSAPTGIEKLLMLKKKHTESSIVLWLESHNCTEDRNIS